MEGILKNLQTPQHQNIFWIHRPFLCRPQQQKKALLQINHFLASVSNSQEILRSSLAYPSSSRTFPHPQILLVFLISGVTDPPATHYTSQQPSISSLSALQQVHCKFLGIAYEGLTLLPTFEPHLPPFHTSCPMPNSRFFIESTIYYNNNNNNRIVITQCLFYTCSPQLEMLIF